MLKLFKKKEDKRIEDIVNTFTEEINEMYKELIRINDEGTQKILNKCDEIIKICEEARKICREVSEK